MKSNPRKKTAGATAEPGPTECDSIAISERRTGGNSPPIEAIIAEQPFLARVSPEFHRFFAECASLKNLADGETLFREGGAANRFYLVRNGCIALTTSTARDGAVTVQILKPGEAVGWSWLVPPYRWPFAATAIGPVELIVFDARCLRKRGRENNPFYRELLNRIVQCLIYGNGRQTTPSNHGRETRCANDT